MCIMHFTNSHHKHHPYTTRIFPLFYPSHHVRTYILVENKFNSICCFSPRVVRSYTRGGNASKAIHHSCKIYCLHDVSDTNYWLSFSLLESSYHTLYERSLFEHRVQQCWMFHHHWMMLPMDDGWLTTSKNIFVSSYWPISLSRYWLENFLANTFLCVL